MKRIAATILATLAVLLLLGFKADWGHMIRKVDFRTYAALCADGLIPTCEVVVVAGENGSVTTGEEIVWPGSAAYNGHLTAATTVRVKAGGNAADDTAGAGAREVTVYCLSLAGAEISEAIDTAGASASTATTIECWRINDVRVTAAGTYGESNTGAITIENGAGTADLAVMPIGNGMWSATHYSVPADKTAIILGWDASFSAAVAGHVHLVVWEGTDDVTVPFSAPIHVDCENTFLDNAVKDLSMTPIEVPEMSDIWVSAQTTSGTTAVASTIRLLVIDN